MCVLFGCYIENKLKLTDTMDDAECSKGCDTPPKKKRRTNNPQNFLSSYTEKWPCLKPSRLEHHAFCTVCNYDFDISHQGASGMFILFNALFSDIVFYSKTNLTQINMVCFLPFNKCYRHFNILFSKLEYSSCKSLSENPSLCI